MDELTRILLSSALGFIGTLVGASITWWVTSRVAKTQVVFDLYREFNSDPLLTSRHKAQNSLSLFDKSPVTLDQMFSTLSADERAHIWNIVHFYEKLYLFIKYKRCDTKFVPALFGEVFFWWYLNCFEMKLIPIQDREASIRLKALKTWFEKKTPKEEIARWVSRAARTAKESIGASSV
jgi:hypothetical protein